MKFSEIFSRRKSEIPAPAIEFQPDALEIAHARLPWWARYSAIFAFLFMLGVILWATVSKVDIIVVGNGKIVSDKPAIVMKPLELTVIDRIHVRVGEVVQPGQPLVSFRPTINMAEAHRLEMEIESLTAEYERLQAEFYGRPYAAPVKTGFPKLQQAIFEQRREYFQQKISYYDEVLKQIDAQKKSREENLAKQRERLAEIKKLEKSFDYLMTRKALTLKDMTEIKLSRMQMEATVDELENALLELAHQREGTISSKNAFIQEWRNAVSEKLVETDRELSANKQQYEKNKMRVESLQLRAPCEAVVHEIASFAEGSAVREAEALITLIPLDGTLELEAEIRPQDIGKVSVGSEVRIKLNAYPFQKYGTLDGRVRNISADTFTQQGRGAMDPMQSASFYRTLISVSGQLHNTPERFRLIPGMEVTAEIKTGRRRIIEYLIYPLIKALDETAREP